MITRQVVAIDQRINHSANIFGIRFPLQVEPTIYRITETIATEYDGGYWQFYELSNGGFYMAPDLDRQFEVVCENGYEGKLSADALGIVACLYTYSNLSFGGAKEFAEICAQHYHWLRDYTLVNTEANAILGAID